MSRWLYQKNIRCMVVVVVVVVVCLCVCLSVCPAVLLMFFLFSRPTRCISFFYFLTFSSSSSSSHPAIWPNNGVEYHQQASCRPVPLQFVTGGHSVSRLFSRRLPRDKPSRQSSLFHFKHLIITRDEWSSTDYTRQRYFIYFKVLTTQTEKSLLSIANTSFLFFTELRNVAGIKIGIHSHDCWVLLFVFFIFIWLCGSCRFGTNKV